MAKLMVKHAKAYRGMEAWSEKIALRDLYSPDTLEVRMEVHALHKNGDSWVWDDSECSNAQNKRVVHFQLGENEKFRGIPDAENQVAKWLAMWMNTCEQNSAFPSGMQYDSEPSSSGDTRPVIYRFDGDVETTDDKLRQIRYAWQTIWEESGWRPLTLNVMEYAGHEKYKDIQADIEKSELTQSQRRTIWKYVAMSAVGGGFVAHPDTFPMQSFLEEGRQLPNDGRLTLYDDKVPCLMSGNAEEWLKIARHMARNARSYKGKEEQWSEALALKEEWLYSDGVALQNEVWPVGGELSESSWKWSTTECKRTSEKRAVHFSVDDIVSDVPDPAERIVQWLGTWLTSCDPSTHFTNS